jgi:hypothetical protein
VTTDETERRVDTVPREVGRDGNCPAEERRGGDERMNAAFADPVTDRGDEQGER